MRKNNIYTFFLTTMIGFSVFTQDMSKTKDSRAVQDLNTLFILKDGALKTFELTPDMKIPAILDSEILASDKGKGTMVRFRTLADVPNPRTNKIEIQKGAILVARTGSFDKDQIADYVSGRKESKVKETDKDEKK